MKARSTRMAECRDEMQAQDFMTEDCSMKEYGFFVNVEVDADEEILKKIVDEYAGVQIKFDDNFVGVDSPFNSTAALVHMG